MIGDTGKIVVVREDAFRKECRYEPEVALQNGESLVIDYETMTYRVVKSEDGLVHFPGDGTLSLGPTPHFVSPKP